MQSSIPDRRGVSTARGHQSHIASSREQAVREAAPYYEENTKMFGELHLVRALTDEQIAAMRDPRLVGLDPGRAAAVRQSGDGPRSSQP
jgi:hypothetical protein